MLNKAMSGFLMVTILSLMWSGRPVIENSRRDNPFAPSEISEVDSILGSLSDDERIGQLFVVANPDSIDKIAGGYLFNELDGIPQFLLQRKTALHLYVGIELKELKRDVFSEEILGRILDSAVIADYTQSIGARLSEKGVNFVIGPSLDVVSENSTVTNSAFGEDPDHVSFAARAFINGFEKSNVACIAGSFPGLGNSRQVTESEPPMVFSRKKELYQSDLVPFKTLINQGLRHMLVGNVFVPAIDSGSNLLASASPRMHDQIKTKLGYNGLVWADLTGSSTSGAVDHFLAGNDIMIVNHEMTSHLNNVKQAIRAGLVTMNDVDAKCKRVIQAKLWQKKNDRLKEVENDEVMQRRALQASLVLLRNESNLIPLKRLDTLSVGLVKISASPKNDSLAGLVNRYTPSMVAQFDYDKLESDFSIFAKEQSAINSLIIMVDAESDLPRKRYGMSLHTQSVIERLSYSQPTVLVWTGNPKALIHVSAIPNIKAIVVGHRESPLMDDFVLQSIFGGRSMSGELRRKVGDDFERSFGIKTEKTRLAYGIPEEVGIDRIHLSEIDTIVKSAVGQKATPGGQVWFAKDGMVVVNKAFGYHTYQEEAPVKNDDLYDLASITKIAGSVAGLMKLTQDSLFNLDHSLCDYLGEWVDTTDYQNMGMREILAHQAGLPAFIPFYTKTVRKGVPRFDIYSLAQNDIYPYRVAREMYIIKNQPDRMFRQIINHPIKSEKRYKYSDVGYYFMLRIIEKQSGMPMNQYLDSVYYKPLGMATMTYRPREKFDKSRITPTEYDKYFRNQLVHGDVHDPGAAMLGGVGGHAGLFSNADDLGKLMQLYLNNGEYGGQHYFDSAVIADFTRCQFCENDNRRGAGFDKPVTDRSPGPSCGCTSLDAFGHQGFTGTTTWADPNEKVAYVFLSNRIYPSAENRKLAQMNIRTDIQQVFYDAIEKSRVTRDANNL